MNVVLLTTDTTHHRYFAAKLAEGFTLRGVLLETRVAAPPFETFHPFEATRDAYERDVLLGGRRADFADIAETRTVESVNEGVAELRSFAPDVVLSFGVGRLLEPAIRCASTACLNLHGGDPERYRGLDTHLWAVYHGDFDAIVTTMHHVDEHLDTGAIAFQSPLPLEQVAALHELRAVNTEMCVTLSRQALATLAERGQVPSLPQVGRGRYYSFMPAVLKDVCVRRFDEHVRAR